MSESLRNDGRIWVPQQEGRRRGRPTRSPRPSATTTSSGKYPSFGNLAPRDIASRAAKEVCDEGRGVGAERPRRLPRLRGRDQAPRRGRRSASATATSSTCTSASPDENPYKVPMRIYPAVALHDGRPLGGLQPDVQRSRACSSLGEANFSDHGANRLGASALMQGLADGYFVLPYTIGNYLARTKQATPSTRRTPAFKRRRGRRRRARQAAARRSRASARSTPSTRSSARSCGRTAAWRATRRACETALQKIPALREEFWKNVTVAGHRRGAQPVAREGGPRRRLPRARRAACAATRSQREESCGGHFREEYQTAGRRGEARRREVLPRRGLGVRGRRQGAGPPRRAARVRERPPRAEELQVRADAERLAPEGREVRRARSSRTTLPTSAPTCRSSRCSTS